MGWAPRPPALGLTRCPVASRRGLGTRDILGAWGRRPMSGSSRTLRAGTRFVARCVSLLRTSRPERRHTRSLIFIWTITHRARGHRRRGYQPPSVDALPFCRASVMTSHRPATGAEGYDAIAFGPDREWQRHDPEVFANWLHRETPELEDEFGGATGLPRSRSSWIA